MAKGKLIGITALARSGKDTFADMLVEGTCLSKYSFAQPIKDVCCDLFNWGFKEREGYLKEVKQTVIFPTQHHFSACAQHYIPDLTDAEVLSMWERFVSLFCGGFIKGHIVTTSPRRMFQLYGTEIGRDTRESLWLDQAKILLESGKSIIIPDVRFENEAEWVREHGTLVHIKRDDKERIAEHISEQGISEEGDDIVIDNNGSLASLRYAAELLIATHLDSFRPLPNNIALMGEHK